MTSNVVQLVVLIVLVVVLAAERVAASRCHARCDAWNRDPVAAWEREHGPVAWNNPDAVNPRLLSCECR